MKGQASTEYLIILAVVILVAVIVVVVMNWFALPSLLSIKGVPITDITDQAEWECTSFKTVPTVVNITEYCDNEDNLMNVMSKIECYDAIRCGGKYPSISILFAPHICLSPKCYTQCLALDTDGDGYAVVGSTKVCTEYVLVKKVTP